MDYEKLGNNIRNLRVKADMTQDDLAKRIGVCRSFVTYLEQGFRKPNTEMLLRISKVFGVTIDSLIHG